MAHRTTMLRKRPLARLSAELLALEPAYEDECGARPNEVETAFAKLARRRGKKALRNGWPDFLVCDEASGGTVAVEVKRYPDEVSAAQARMFVALERAGVTVKVWDPRQPQTLQSWRRYYDEKPVELSIGPVPRPPKLGLVRAAPGARRRPPR